MQVPQGIWCIWVSRFPISQIFNPENYLDATVFHQRMNVLQELLSLFFVRYIHILSQFRRFVEWKTIFRSVSKTLLKCSLYSLGKVPFSNNTYDIYLISEFHREACMEPSYCDVKFPRQKRNLSWGAISRLWTQQKWLNFSLRPAPHE